MNCFNSLRTARWTFKVGTSSGIINRSIRIYLTKPFSSYCHFVGKSRLGYLNGSLVKQIASGSKRVISNDASSIPSYKTKDHAQVWIMERILSVGLLGAIGFMIFLPSDHVEYTAALLLSAHLHWGLEAICTDYLRPAVVGNFIPKCIPFIVIIPVTFALYGFVNSTMSERGITFVCKQFWYLKTTEQLKEVGETL